MSRTQSSTTSAKSPKSSSFTSSLNWSWIELSSKLTGETTYLYSTTRACYAAELNASVEKVPSAIQLQIRKRYSTEENKNCNTTSTSLGWSKPFRIWTSINRYNLTTMNDSCCSFSVETALKQTVRVTERIRKIGKSITGRIIKISKAEKALLAISNRSWTIYNRKISNTKCAVFF